MPYKVGLPPPIPKRMAALDATVWSGRAGPLILMPYLGSRRMFAPRIIAELEKQITPETQEYREPFVGGGSVAIAMMSRHPNLRPWLNDRDYAVAAAWWSARYRPEDLIARVYEIPGGDRPPGGYSSEKQSAMVKAYREFVAHSQSLTALPQTPEELVTIGFRRLYLQYNSGHSWGGGERGGRRQTGSERIDARWNPARISHYIRLIHQRLKRTATKITAYDFARVIDDDSARAVLFFDPPFFGYQSNYAYDLDEADHRRLADLLHRTRHGWVMTIGDHPLMRDLYDGLIVEHLGYNQVLVSKPGR